MLRVMTFRVRLSTRAIVDCAKYSTRLNIPELNTLFVFMITLFTAALMHISIVSQYVIRSSS